MLNKKDEISLKHLRNRVDALQKALQPLGGVMPHVPDVLLGHYVSSVVRAMFAYRPAVVATALYAEGLCPTCAAALTNAAQAAPLTREAALNILRQVVAGDLMEDHLDAQLAREALGPDAVKIEEDLRRQYREGARKGDYMVRKHRVPGSAYSAKR